MSSQAQVPETSVTMPGFFHLLAVLGEPKSGNVAEFNGIPVGKLILGRLETGQTAVLSTTSVAELDRLESAIQVLRSQLSMWHADHPKRVA